MRGKNVGGIQIGLSGPDAGTRMGGNGTGPLTFTTQTAADQDLPEEYGAALHRYLMRADGHSLEVAAEIGRKWAAGGHTAGDLTSAWLGATRQDVASVNAHFDHTQAFPMTKST